MNWLKDTSGERSASFTIAIAASAVALVSFAVSMFGIVAHPVSGVDCAALASPFLAIYSWRRGARGEKDDNPSKTA